LCLGGSRWANTFIALMSLGLPGFWNYVSSWGGWGNRDDTRIVVPE
jgi:3-mercaptopyruvate sulfurtransferase SseA